MIKLPVELIFAFLVIYAAISDYKTLKIPNWISLALCGLFVVYAANLTSWNEIGLHFAVGGGVFVTAVLCYSFGVFGGGDVKLLGAVALWAGPERVYEFAALTGLIGGALGLLILAARIVGREFPELANRPSPVWNIARWGRDGTCPYGIPISIAAILSVPAMFAT